VVLDVPEGELEELSEVERIIHVLRRTGGNKAKAARILGIDRSTLYRKIRENRIDVQIPEV
jgi:transcriptional regulator of acetoin/glycerol metabolism